jgi:hypothetical protein
MTRFKDFGSPKIEVEPLSFKLHGQTFECVPAIQGMALLDIGKAAASGDNASAAALVTDFFPKVMDAETYARFDKLMHDPKKITKVEVLGEIIGWLMEEYSGRPEEQPGA